MDIVVLVKQTFDTEEQIACKDGKIREEGVKFVINPYDEFAIEEAIRLREAHGGHVTVVSMGPQRTEEALRSALAMGADEAILADDPALFGDESTTAHVLSAIILQRQYDLVIAGNQAVDYGSGQVAVRLAEILNIPHISSLTKLVVEDGELTGYRDAEGDEEVAVAKLPALVTAQQGLNEPRYPTLIGIRKAGRKPLIHVTLSDLNLSEADIKPKTKTIDTFLPKGKVAGKVLSGELADQVRELVHALYMVDKVVS